MFERFKQFHRNNPKIWHLFSGYTLDAIKRGREHYSSKTIFERIRWHYEIETKSDDCFKLNNNYTAYYSRLFHAMFPQYDGFFRNRGELDATTDDFKRMMV